MKQILKSMIMIIAALTLFTTAVFAWFTLSGENNIQPVNAEIIRRDLDVDVEYGINGGGYTSFDESAAINAFLSNMLPGDFINIRVVVRNANQIGDPDMGLDVILHNIRATQTNIEYDLTDFFFLDNGVINLQWFESAQDYVVDNYYLNQNISAALIDESAIEYLGYDLEMYRMNNLFNQVLVEEELVIKNDIKILQSNLASQHIVVIEFSIGLDPYTPDHGLGFQNGELLIDGLYTLIVE